MSAKKDDGLKIVDPYLAMPMALGDVFVKSGMFKDIKTQAEAVVKIIAGRELGLPPIQSMNEIFIVNGKTSVTAKIIGALLIKSGNYSYTIDKLDDEGCTLTFFSIKGDKKVELGKSTFSKSDAAKAGLINKDVWKNYPRNMYFSRALANGQRWYAPDIFSGYTTEEIESIPEGAIETTLEFNADGTQALEENNG